MISKVGKWRGGETRRTDGSLIDLLERVREGAARDHADRTDAGAKGVHHGAVEAVLGGKSCE